MANSLLSDISPTTSSNSLLQDISTDTGGGGGDHPVTDEVGQIFSNLGKHAAVGVGRLADLPGQVWDLAFHPGSDDNPTDIATQATKKAVGPTKNEGPLGRIVGAGLEAGPSAILGGPEAAVPSLIPTMASGAASQTAKEAGFGPAGQFVAGLAPFTPSIAAAGVRGLVRGGEQGAAETAQNLANAKEAGINLSTGQATGNKVIQGAETVGAKIPVGNKPLAATRGEGLNNQAEESVSNIVKKISPSYNQEPPTPTAAGETIKSGVDKRIEGLKQETSEAKEGMETAVGGKDTPMSAPRLESTLAKVTGSTGIDQIDNLVTGAKTKAVAKAVKGVTEQPQVPTSYSTDGEGYHFVSSPNGETHAVETATGDLKVTRSDTAEGARGNGEGSARLESLAQVATSKGKNLVSDVSVSPAEAAAYEKLGRKGWAVEKNPNAEVNPSTGNTISDSPKNPVYTVKAPTTVSTEQPLSPKQSSEKQFTGEWTYNPQTGKSEPVTSQPSAEGPQPAASAAALNSPTPWTFDSLRQLRTLIGSGISSTRNPGQQGQLKLLYGALSEDLKEGVRAKGEQAEQSYNLFNSVAKQNIGTQKVLTRAINKLGGPEQVFKAAIAGTKDGATKISPIMESLDEDGKSLFRATVLHRLGRVGGAVDAPFDANTFLKNWQSMSPEAKNVLFNTKTGWGAPGQLRSSLDSLGNTLDLLKKQGYIKSGLGKETSAIQHTVMGGVVALLADRAAETGAHLMAGNHLAAVGAAVGAGGTLALNPVMSKVLTDPKTVAWLAQATKAPRAMIPVLITQLNQMSSNNPDAKNLAQLISEARQ